MQTIKPNFENQPITEPVVKDPDEAIKNVRQIIQVKQNSIEDSNVQIDNLEFARLLRKVVKTFGSLGIVILTALCILFTKDIVTTVCVFGTLTFFEIGFMKGTKSSKVIEKEIKILNLDIQHELLEIEDLENEIAYLQSLSVSPQNIGQTSIEFDSIETIKQIDSVRDYAEEKHKPKTRTKIPEKVSYTKDV